MDEKQLVRLAKEVFIEEQQYFLPRLKSKLRLFFMDEERRKQFLSFLKRNIFRDRVLYIIKENDLSAEEAVKLIETVFEQLLS